MKRVEDTDLPNLNTADAAGAGPGCVGGGGGAVLADGMIFTISLKVCYRDQCFH